MFSYKDQDVLNTVNREINTYILMLSYIIPIGIFLSHFSPELNGSNEICGGING